MTEQRTPLMTTTGAHKQEACLFDVDMTHPVYPSWPRLRIAGAYAVGCANEATRDRDNRVYEQGTGVAPVQALDQLRKFVVQHAMAGSNVLLTMHARAATHAPEFDGLTVHGIIDWHREQAHDEANAMVEADALRLTAAEWAMDGHGIAAPVETNSLQAGQQ
jgi:hypothetical protein